MLVSRFPGAEAETPNACVRYPLQKSNSLLLYVFAYFLLAWNMALRLSSRQAVCPESPVSPTLTADGQLSSALLLSWLLVFQGTRPIACLFGLDVHSHKMHL